jgi:hypothetical protein
MAINLRAKLLNGCGKVTSEKIGRIPVLVRNMNGNF